MKQLKLNKMKNSKGFSILAVILVIVVIIVAIGSWTLSGQTNTSNLASRNISMAVTGLINDSLAVQSAYNQLVLEGNDYTKIVFLPNTASTLNAPNVLDPTTGISMPKVNTSLLRIGATHPEGIWIINPKDFLAYLGETDKPDPTLVAVGINDLACKEINKQLNGNETKYGIGIVNFNPSDATVNNPKTGAFINLTTRAHMKGIVSGCISTSIADKNFYFRVLKIA